eukprot:m.74565 g.74565  ORF g.74565 m.74565 type:complete len:66 (+) comp14443_c0_seq3:88-285(+)
MATYGEIVVIKRSGKDGPKFPLMDSACVFGRHLDCDIRIQKPEVSNQHARIQVDEDSKVLRVKVH